MPDLLSMPRSLRQEGRKGSRSGQGRKGSAAPERAGRGFAAGREAGARRFADTRQSSGDRREQLLGRILWGVVLALGLFLAGQLTFQFAVSPRLRIRHIVVRGDLALSQAEILRLAGMEGRDWFFSLNPQELTRKLEALPQVRRAAVRKVFPDTLRIDLAARVPLAACLAETEEGPSLPAVVDAEGVVFQTGSRGVPSAELQATSASQDLPVVSGLKFRSLQPGLELPRLLSPLLRQIGELKEKQPDLYRLISEVRVVPVNEVRYELLVYPVFGTTRIRTAGGLDAATLKNAFLVLDLMQREGLAAKVQEIDFRTQEVVYRTREEGPVGGE